MDPTRLAPLLRSRERFLRFLAPRLPSPGDAEEILQSALLRTLERGSSAAFETDDDVVNWFFRVLKNAVLDHHRQGATARAATEKLASEWSVEAPPPELRPALCDCLKDLLPTLKPAYAEMVTEVDLGERSVSEVAKQIGITADNASVRLHRGRRALKEQLARTCGACAAHGCLDCSCERRPRS